MTAATYQLLAFLHVLLLTSRFAPLQLLLLLQLQLEPQLERQYFLTKPTTLLTKFADQELLLRGRIHL